jgi:ABC-type polysaccharide/polyol phosphate export permease
MTSVRTDETGQVIRMPEALRPVYDSGARHSRLIEEFRGLVRRRDLLILLVQRNVKTRYKRSFLGVAWSLMNPLLNTAVLTFVLSTVFRSAVHAYAPYVLAGLICWTFLSQTTTYSISMLVWGSGLLHRVHLPRSVFAVAAVGTGLLNLGLSLLPLVLLMAMLGLPFRLSLGFLPVAIVLLALFTLGLALFVSTLAVFFTDVVEIYQTLLQAWFFLTPVFYPREALPAGYAVYLYLNPMTHLIDLFRIPILTGAMPGAGTIAAATISAITMFLVGSWVFARRADQFLYYL